MDVWPRKNGVFPPIRRFQTKSWDCLGQNWTGWNVNGNPGDWWLMTPTGVSSIFEHGTCRYWPRWLTWDPKNPKDFSRVWIPNKHCIELSQHFPSNVYPDVGNTMEHLPPIIEIDGSPGFGDDPWGISPGVGFVDAMWTKWRIGSGTDLDQRCSSWFINIAILCFSQIWNWKMIGILCWILCSST
jgi:hypothetical protein